jgi:hypothetical protein
MCTVSIDLKCKALRFDEPLTLRQHLALGACKRIERDELSGVYKVAQGAAWQSALREAELAVKS